MIMPPKTEQLIGISRLLPRGRKDAAVFGNGDEAFAKVRLLLNTQAQIVAYADRRKPTITPS